MASRVVLNPDRERLVLELPGVVTARRQLAKTVADRAKTLVSRDSGNYARRLTVVVENGDVAVVAKDIAAHIIEFGSVRTPAQAPLRRAAVSLGLRVEDTPRP